MKAIVSGFHTDVFPLDEEVKEFCKPGRGADTCIWLLMGPKGWECSALHKPIPLYERWRKGETTAKRDGCDKVNNFDASGKMGEVEI